MYFFLRKMGGAELISGPEMCQQKPETKKL